MDEGTYFWFVHNVEHFFFGFKFGLVVAGSVVAVAGISGVPTVSVRLLEGQVLRLGQLVGVDRGADGGGGGGGGVGGPRGLALEGFSAAVPEAVADVQTFLGNHTNSTAAY